MGKSKRELMPHQWDADAILRRLKGCAGLFIIPGGGKTLPTVRYVQPANRRRRPYYPAIVLCRRDDFLTWQTELQNEGIPERDIFAIDHRIKAGVELEMPDFEDLPPWTLCTYDLVKKPGVKPHKNYKKKILPVLSHIGLWIKSIPFEVAIGDELHMIKRWDSGRTKKVIQCTRHIPRRIGLTGTPITNSPEDVFSQCYFIDNGATFGKDHWRFKKTYWIKSGPGWYIKRDSKDKIKKKLKNVALYVGEEDMKHLKLPKALPPIIKGVPMMGRQKRIYEKLVNEWEAEIPGREGEIELDYVIAVIQKLKQVASGFIYDENKVGIPIKNNKIKLLETMLKDEDYLGRKEKIIIWTSFTYENEIINKLLNKMKITNIVYDGARKEREQKRKDFLNIKERCVWVSGVERGVGMNELRHATDAVYYSNSQKVVAKEQSMRRNRRKGSDRLSNRRYWELVTEGSVDLPLLKNINQSRSFAEYVLSGIRAGKGLRKLCK